MIYFEMFFLVIFCSYLSLGCFPGWMTTWHTQVVLKFIHALLMLRVAGLQAALSFLAAMHAFRRSRSEYCFWPQPCLVVAPPAVQWECSMIWPMTIFERIWMIWGIPWLLQLQAPSCPEPWSAASHVKLCGNHAASEGFFWFLAVLLVYSRVWLSFEKWESVVQGLCTTKKCAGHVVASKCLAIAAPILCQNEMNWGWVQWIPDATDPFKAQYFRKLPRHK